MLIAPSAAAATSKAPPAPASVSLSDDAPLSFPPGAPQLIEYASHSLSFAPFDVRWIPCSTRLLTLGCLPRGTGTLHILDVAEGGKLKSVSSLERKEGFKCGSFGASSYEERRIATGGYSGSLEIFDVERLAEGKSTFRVQAHSSIINSLDAIGGLNLGFGAPEVVTGGRDGCVKIWDPRVDTPVASLLPAAQQTPRDCWAVAFGHSFNVEERCVVAGFDNGDIKLFDLKMNKILWDTNVGNGVAGLQFDRRDISMNKLLVTTLEAKFRVYDMRTRHPTEGYSYLVEKGHKSTVWTGKHCPDNRDLFITTGGNGSINLYKYNYPSQRTVKGEGGHERGVMGDVTSLSSLKVSEQPVVAFDWCAEKMGVAALAALDQTVKVIIVTKLNTF